jgi:hypothetical protein
VVHPHPGATSTKYSSLLASVNQVTTHSHPNPSLHRTKYLRSSLDPSSLHYNTKPSTVSHRDLHSTMQALHKMHKALITKIQPLALSLHHIDISWVNPWNIIPILLHYPPKPKKGSSFHDFHFALRSIFDKLSKSQKQSNMTKCSSKLGQGPTCSQHSPVTHPESLRSW